MSSLVPTARGETGFTETPLPDQAILRIIDIQIVRPLFARVSKRFERDLIKLLMAIR